MRLDEPPDLIAPTTPITEAEMLKELENFMEGISLEDEFSGVVLLAKGEKPIFRKAYGLASKEYNIPNRVDTRFNLGSINKFITRIAIEQLEGKGELRFEDPIKKHLPDYPNKEAVDKVTIRHLLDMTSGIGDFFGERYQSTPKDRIRTLSDYLLLFGDEPLLFEPGTNRQYSNGGYIVLGLIIEKVSGQTYFDYVRDHIYKIAGMGNTAHLEADVPAENVASGYTNNWDENDHPGEPRRNNIYTRPARGSSAGGGYSTVDDLLKLVVALKKNELSATRTSDEINQHGIAIAGGAPGINAYVETDPETGYVIIVLSNYDPPAVDKVARKINSFLERLK
jgi:CubicO group peptidase (beta-lactamase class C family)